MQERDEGAIFAEPVDKQLYPEYYQVHCVPSAARFCTVDVSRGCLQVITNPMDLGTVMQNLQCDPLLLACSAVARL